MDYLIIFIIKYLYKWLFLLTKYGSECALDLKILYDPSGQSFKLNVNMGTSDLKSTLYPWMEKRRYLTPYILMVGGELWLLIGVRSRPLPKE
jgi:hypothetical protein